MGAMTEEQAAFLNEQLEDCTLRPGPGYRILFGSDNTRPMIRDLVEAGILEAYDVMRERPTTGAPVRIMGQEIPVVMTLVGSYRLTRQGAAELAALKPQP